MRKRVTKVRAKSRNPYSILVHPLKTTLNVGTIITIDEVEAVSRSNFVPLGHPRQFVITEKATPYCTKLKIYPALKARGKYRTVTKKPIVGATIFRIITPKYEWIEMFCSHNRIME